MVRLKQHLCRKGENEQMYIQASDKKRAVHRQQGLLRIQNCIIKPFMDAILSKVAIGDPVVPVVLQASIPALETTVCA